MFTRLRALIKQTGMSHSCDWLVLRLLCGIGVGSVLVVELEAREVWEEQAAAYDWVGLGCAFVTGGNWEEAVLVVRR